MHNRNLPIVENSLFQSNRSRLVSDKASTFPPKGRGERGVVLRRPIALWLIAVEEAPLPRFGAQDSLIEED